MLIARQKPDATNVGGIRTWNSLGRFVKRGEKGILILAPMVSYRRSRQNEIATDINTDNAADERTPEQQLIGFRAVYVFDRHQPDRRKGTANPHRSAWRRERVSRTTVRLRAIARRGIELLRAHCSRKGSLARRQDHAALGQEASRGVFDAGARDRPLMWRSDLCGARHWAGLKTRPRARTSTT